MSAELILVISLALGFGLLNGMRDSSSIVATAISSRAFHPRTALGMTAVAEFVGPFLFGTSVAKTIGSDIVVPTVMTLSVLVACLCGAIIWSLITWYLAIPSSSSHALAGGLMGAALVASSWSAIKLGGLYKVLIALFFTPLVAFVAGFVILRIIYFLARNSSPTINEWFKRSQLVTTLALAFSHGTNDAQKTMGIITLGLLISRNLSQFGVPAWVLFASAGTMGIGTLLGGWRLIRTLGGRFYKIRPVHSFSTQLSSALVVMSASLLGLPTSTTQVVSSAIIGVGSSERMAQVRWSVADDIVTTWIVTIPVSALLSGCIYWIIVHVS